MMLHFPLARHEALPAGDYRYLPAALRDTVLSASLSPNFNGAIRFIWSSVIEDGCLSRKACAFKMATWG